MYRSLLKICVLSTLFPFVSSCESHEIDSIDDVIIPEVIPSDSVLNISLQKGEYVYLLEEGNWQSDNGQVSFLDSTGIYRNYFATQNGFKVGDTPEDIIYLPKERLLVISVNWSNIVYWCDIDLHVIAATENVPNCRMLCYDDNGYVYITSYAHTTALGEVYTKGYVAKISIATKCVESTCEVGWEPEGIAYWNGKLYVANTGGYAFSESHEYEHSVSVIDAVTMCIDTTINIIDSKGNPVINLYGEMSQSGSYLCINSPGDYYNILPSTTIFNCDSLTYHVYEEIPCTYNTVLTSGKFFVVGSYFTYNTGEYVYSIATIDPITKKLYASYYELPDGSLSTLPDSLINTMTNPYCVYQNPYTGVLYMVDAESYACPGKVFSISTDGEVQKFFDGKLRTYRECYINAGHMIALPPDDYTAHVSY